MKGAVIAVAAAAVAFILVGAPTGVLQMLDPDYCISHEKRPGSVPPYEESLSFIPPGPVCVFTKRDGETKRVGPGWWPAITTCLAALTGVAAFRLVTGHHKRVE